MLFPARQKFPLHISQDGNNTAVAELARSTEPAIFNLTHVDPSQIPVIVHMQHIQADNFPTRQKSEPIAYYRIASHYKFVMRQMFDCWQYPKLIILEVCVHTLHSVCSVHELIPCFKYVLQRLHLHFSFVHCMHLDGCPHLLDQGANSASIDMYHSLYVATCYTLTTIGC